VPWVQLRANASGVRWGTQDLEEYLVSPAIQVALAGPVDFTAEYTRWWMPRVQDTPFVDRFETVFTATF